ncbi:MAG: hypothetical protein ACOCYX_05705 [Spirochaetota bacterium]
MEGPVEYRHSLSTIVNRCIAEGPSIDGLWECLGDAADPEPGSWDHFERVAPPWLVVWTTRTGP